MKPVGKIAEKVGVYFWQYGTVFECRINI